jgi:hypothetical protein
MCKPSSKPKSTISIGRISHTCKDMKQFHSVEYIREKTSGLGDLEDLRLSTSYCTPSLPGSTHIVESFWGRKGQIPIRLRRCTRWDELIELKSSIWGPSKLFYKKPLEYDRDFVKRRAFSMSDSIPYCGQQLIGVSIAIALVQVLVVGARLYTRHIQKVAYGIDDYLIIPALVRSELTYSSCLLLC